MKFTSRIVCKKENSNFSRGNKEASLFALHTIRILCEYFVFNSVNCFCFFEEPATRAVCVSFRSSDIVFAKDLFKHKRL